MKKLVKWLALSLGAVVLVAVLVLAYARSKAEAAYAETWETPEHAVPIPFPLTDAEIEALRAERAAAPTGASDAPSAEPAPPADPLEGLDLEALALERAIERGRRLVTTRLGCHDCHGADFGGTVVMDVPPVGALIAPNITEGEGSVTQG